MFFLKRAYQINIEKREPFCCTHFKNLTRNNFRQFIHKFKDIIEVEIKSNPCFYKLKGLNVSSLRNFVTDEAKGVIMLSLLENLKEQQPAIHDLKFSIESNIHQYLKENYPVNQNNNGIKLQVPSFDKNILIKAMIYPKNIQLDIGCSYKPFIYDLSGTLNLCSIFRSNFVLSTHNFSSECQNSSHLFLGYYSLSFWQRWFRNMVWKIISSYI